MGLFPEKPTEIPSVTARKQVCLLSFILCMGYGYDLMVECWPSMPILGYSVPRNKSNNSTIIHI